MYPAESAQLGRTHFRRIPQVCYLAKSMNPSLKMLRYVAAVVLVIAIAVLVAQKLDFASLVETVRDANYFYLVPSSLMNMIVVGNIILRWQNLLNGRARFMECFAANQIGAYLNNILPLRMGDFARSYVLRRHVPHLSMVAILSSIGAELTMDMIFLMLLMAVVLLTLPLPPLLVSAGGLLAAATVIAAAALFTLSRSDLLIEKVIRPFSVRFLPHPLQDMVLHLVVHVRDGLTSLRSNRQLAYLLLLTINGYLLQILANWFLLRVFLDEVTLQAALVALVGTGVGLALPLLPSSAGTYELAIVLALSALGIDTESATAYALLMRTQQFTITAVMGSLFMLKEGLSVTELRQAVHQVSAEV